jgi:hypothetical protein
MGQLWRMNNSSNQATSRTEQITDPKYCIIHKVVATILFPKTNNVANPP